MAEPKIPVFPNAMTRRLTERNRNRLARAQHNDGKGTARSSGSNMRLMFHLRKKKATA